MAKNDSVFEYNIFEYFNILLSNGVLSFEQIGAIYCDIL